jgi:hypothetical protein
VSLRTIREGRADPPVLALAAFLTPQYRLLAKQYETPARKGDPDDDAVRESAEAQASALTRYRIRHLWASTSGGMDAALTAPPNTCKRAGNVRVRGIIVVVD